MDAQGYLVNLNSAAGYAKLKGGNPIDAETCSKDPSNPVCAQSYISLNPNVIPSPTISPTGKEIPGVKSVTIEVWLTTGANKDWERIFQFGSDGSKNADSIFVMKDKSSQQLCAAYVNQHEDYYNWEICSPFIFARQSLLHVALTITDRGQLSFYVNGQKAIKSSWFVDMPIVKFFYIGKSFSRFDSTMMACIYEFRIWHTVLTYDEIFSHWTNGPGERPLYYPTLVSFLIVFFILQSYPYRPGTKAVRRRRRSTTLSLGILEIHRLVRHTYCNLPASPLLVKKSSML